MCWDILQEKAGIIADWWWTTYSQLCRWLTDPIENENHYVPEGKCLIHLSGPHRMIFGPVLRGISVFKLHITLKGGAVTTFSPVYNKGLNYLSSVYTKGRGSLNIFHLCVIGNLTV